MASDPKADEAKEDGGKGGGKKNLIVLIIVAIVMLGIGGGGAYFFLKPDPSAEKHAKGEHGEDSHGEEHHDEEEEEEEEEEECDDGHGGGCGPIFVELETFTVNLQPDPDERFLQLNLTLQVKDEKTKAKVETLMPAIRSRLLLLFGSKEANEISDLEGKELLIEEIMEVLHEPFKKYGRPLKIKGAFFTNFVIQ